MKLARSQVTILYVDEDLAIVALVTTHWHQKTDGLVIESVALLYNS